MLEPELKATAERLKPARTIKNDVFSVYASLPERGVERDRTSHKSPVCACPHQLILINKSQ